MSSALTDDVDRTATSALSGVCHPMELATWQPSGLRDEAGTPMATRCRFFEKRWS